MQKILMVLAGFGLTGAALAQPPEHPRKIEIQEALTVPIAYSEILEFDHPLATSNVLTQGVLRAAARTDRTMTLTGESEGETAMFVYDEDGREIYAARISVTVEHGHSVR